MPIGGRDLLPFHQVWAVDFEYTVMPGEHPDPVCLVAQELNSGELIRLWQSELYRPTPPFPVNDSALFVAYYTPAELGCFKVLGWSMPVRILDLYVEFRALTNGLPVPCGNGLLGALKAYGLEAMSKAEKAGMRERIMNGGPYSAWDKEAILDYCQEDVDALARLIPVMVSRIDLPRALLRGRYMAAVAAMEHTGVPIGVDTLYRLQKVAKRSHCHPRTWLRGESTKMRSAVLWPNWNEQILLTLSIGGQVIACALLSANNG